MQHRPLQHALKSQSGLSFTRIVHFQNGGVIADENLLDHVTQLGDFMRVQLRDRLAAVPGVVQIRGQGLITGIELAVPCTELVKKALERKLLINVTSDKVIRLLPALVMQQHEAEQVIDITCSIIKEFMNSSAEHN